MDDEAVGIIAFGSTDPAIAEARDMLFAEGMKTNYLRLRALPINDKVKEFIKEHDEIFIIEMNHDGQLRQILSAELPEDSTKFISSTLNNGLPLTAAWIRDDILAKKEK